MFHCQALHTHPSPMCLIGLPKIQLDEKLFIHTLGITYEFCRWHMNRPSLFHIDLHISNFTAYIAFESWFKRTSSVGINTGYPGTDRSFICSRYLIISAIATSPKRMIPSFDFIWVNIKTMFICKYYVACLLSVFFVFMRNGLFVWIDTIFRWTSYWEYWYPLMLHFSLELIFWWVEHRC